MELSKAQAMPGIRRKSRWVEVKEVGQGQTLESFLNCRRESDVAGRKTEELWSAEDLTVMTAGTEF